MNNTIIKTAANKTENNYSKYTEMVTDNCQ